MMDMLLMEKMVKLIKKQKMTTLLVTMSMPRKNGRNR